MILRSTTIFLLFLALFVSASAQSCLPGITWFTTQDEIDNFQTNYPGCSEILGTLHIAGDEIVNLSGLDVLTSIHGELYIHGTNRLLSLKGLENITYIGGDIEIFGNDTLLSLEGLDGLDTIHNDLLIGQLFMGNDWLTDLTGLENITVIEQHFGVMYNMNLDNFSGLDNLKWIGGEVLIRDNTFLTSFEGLNNLDSIGWNLTIRFHNRLEDLYGMENLRYINGKLWLQGLHDLENLDGLQNLTDIHGGLTISGNSDLLNIERLQDVTCIGGDVYIATNGSLQSLSGLDSVAPATIADLSIISNYSLSTCHVTSICEYLKSPNGTVDIHDNATGCNSVPEIEELCIVGIDEPDKTMDIEFYPNPANHFVNIRYPRSDPSTISGQVIRYSLLVYDCIGRLVDEFQFTSGDQEIRINTSGYNTGIYNLIFIPESGFTLKSKLAIMK